jgi:hypothetical protein
MGAPLPPETDPQAPPAPATQYSPPPSPPNQFFTADDIEKARREERDKLYGRITRTDERFRTLEDELRTLQTDRESRVAEETRRREEAEAALRTQRESEMDAKTLIAEKEKEWQAQLDQVRQQQATHEAMLTKEREFMALQNFIQRRAAEEHANGTVGPEFIEFINGNNEQEVEASIIKLRTKTDSILKGVREGQTQRQAALPGVSLTGAPPSGGPLDNISGQQRTYTKEDIEKMSMPEYEKFRRQIGVEGAGNNQGLYG